MTDYPPEAFPPRIVIRPDGTDPITVPDELLDEWQGKIIPGEQEYVRADIFAALQAEVARLVQQTAQADKG